MAQETSKRWTELLPAWIQVVALIVTGVFALVEYHSHKEEIKIQRALEFVSQLNAGEVLNAHTALTLQEQQKNSRFQEILSGNKTSQDKINAAYYRFVVCDLLMHGGDHSLEPSFFITNGLLENAASCVNHGLCDEQTIRDHIGHFGKNFVRTYYPYFCFLRAAWKDASIGRDVVSFFSPSAKDACGNFEEALKNNHMSFSSCASGSIVNPA